MKTIKLLLTTTLLFTINTYGQLDKKTWLVGGSGLFDYKKQDVSYTSQLSGELNNQENSISNINLSTNVGYFLKDKFVAGLKFSYFDNLIKGKDGAESGGRIYSFGPFIRYYLLNKEKQYNIIIESNYNYGIIDNGRLSNNENTSEDRINIFTFLVGPEFYFNSSIGIELLIGYKNYNQNSNHVNNLKISENGIFIAIGFQIHLIIKK